MFKSSVSVVIPAYNCEGTISQTLEALLHQSYPANIEIIVIDDGSKDTTKQQVTNYSSVKYFYQKNAGPATARNHGAKKAAHEFICFTDSDCVPEPDWIEKLMRNFEDSNVSVVAGSYSIANREDVLARCIQNEIDFRHEKLMGKFPKSLGSYNFCLRRKVFESVDGFNENYRYASGEDNDLSYKLIEGGFKILFEQEARVQHYHPSRIVQYLKEQFRHGVWRVKMYKDHPHFIQGDDYTFWKDIIEVPLVLGITASFFLMLLKGAVPLLGTAPLFFLFLLMGLVCIEIYFAFLMVKSLSATIIWGSVMFLRAFARTFGFVVGLCRFSLAKNQ